MAKLIGYLVVFIICIGFPCYSHYKEEHKRLEDLYSPKSNDHSTDEWKR